MQFSLLFCHKLFKIKKKKNRINGVVLASPLELTKGLVHLIGYSDHFHFRNPSNVINDV